MAKDMEPEGPKPTSWWRTLPGVVTAVAGLLTALGGLLVTLNQVGLLNHDHGPAAPPSAAAEEVVQPSSAPGSQAAPQAPAPPAATPQAAAVQTVSFPAGAKVTLGNNRGRGTYELLAARLERRTGDAGTLTLQIRLTNAGPADIGFWNDSFRLAVDGVPRAPTSWLNSSVDPRSAKEADVVFTVPLAARSLTLKINSGDEDGEIPLALR
jgi:hypothetical protein